MQIPSSKEFINSAPTYCLTQRTDMTDMSTYTLWLNQFWNWLQPGLFSCTTPVSILHGLLQLIATCRYTAKAEGNASTAAAC